MIVDWESFVNYVEKGMGIYRCNKKNRHSGFLKYRKVYDFATLSLYFSGMKRAPPEDGVAVSP